MSENGDIVLIDNLLRMRLPASVDSLHSGASGVDYYSTPLCPCPASTSAPDKTTSTKSQSSKSVSPRRLYDADAVLSNPSAFKAEEIRTLRDQIASNPERAWEITGRSEDELTGVMVQISQAGAKGFKEGR